MALRMLSCLGWPWDCFKSPDAAFCTILDEYDLSMLCKVDGILPATGFPWGMFPLPATWSCAMWQRAARSWANMRVVTGHAQEGVPKQTVAGKVPSILQSILIKNGAKGSIRWPMAFPWPSQVWLHHPTAHWAKPSAKGCGANATSLNVWEKTFRRLKSFFSSRLQRSIASATKQPKKLFRGWTVFLTVPHSKSKQIASPRRKWK